MHQEAFALCSCAEERTRSQGALRIFLQWQQNDLQFQFPRTEEIFRKSWEIYFFKLSAVAAGVIRKKNKCQWRVLLADHEDSCFQPPLGECATSHQRRWNNLQCW